MRRIWPLALLLSAIVAACGGDEEETSLTKAELVERSGAICERAARAAEDYARNHTRPQTPEEIQAALQEDARIARDAVRRLRALQADADDEPAFDRFIAAESAFATANGEQAAAVGANDEAAFTASSESLLAEAERAKKAARSLGISECPWRPVSAVYANGPEGGGGGSLVGAWVGRVTQYESGEETSTYSVVMDITDTSRPGVVAGTTVYPRFGCGGDLTLSEASGSRYVLSERITSGQENCTGGTIEAEVAGEELSWRWFSEDVEVLGTLQLSGR
jgi:hypothetical protein